MLTHHVTEQNSIPHGAQNISRTAGMQLSEKERDKLRASLASRKSFFGGSLSTAGASRSATYVAASTRLPPVAAKPKQAKDLGAGQQTGASAPQITSPTLQSPPRKATAADYAAFEALAGNTTPEPPKSSTLVAPRPRPEQKHKVVAKPSQTPPRLTSLSRHSPPPRRPATSSPVPSLQQRRPQSRPSPGRKKKGQATRQLAVAPQAVGGPTRRQKADLAWAAQLAELRGNGDAAEPKPTPPPAPGGQLRAARSQTNASKPAQKARPSGIPQQQQRVQARNVQQHMKSKHMQQLNRGAVASRPVQDRVLQQKKPVTPAAAQPRPKSSLAGKDLSKLPEWQRTILEKKLREELRQKRRREEEEEEDEDSALDDFVVDDEEGDWRDALKSITGYDPSRYRNERFDDRSMEADWRTIQAEERRSARLGRTEDDLAEAEEANRQKLKKAAQKRRKTASGFVQH